MKENERISRKIMKMKENEGKRKGMKENEGGNKEK